MSNIIGFPGMGIEQFALKRVAFTIPGINWNVYWYGIIIAVGFVLAVMYALNRAKKLGISSDTVLDLVLWGLPVSILCARIYYVIGDPTVLIGEWYEAFAIWDGGIAIYGGIIGMVLTGVIYCRIKKLNVGKIFDMCMPAVMIGQIIGRWGNFVNAEVYGVSTNLPWGMMVNNKGPFHPLFIYESVWMLIGFLALHFYQDHKRRNGEITFLYLIWYGIGRAWLEGLRQNEYVLKIGGLPMSQITAVIAVIIAVAALVYLYIKKPKMYSAQSGECVGICTEETKQDNISDLDNVNHADVSTATDDEDTR